MFTCAQDYYDQTNCHRFVRAEKSKALWWQAALITIKNKILIHSLCCHLMQSGAILYYLLLFPANVKLFIQWAAWNSDQKASNVQNDTCSH